MQTLGTQYVQTGTITNVAGTQSGDVKTQAFTNHPNCLTNISSGTTSTTRIGNLVEPAWIRCKGLISACMYKGRTDPETIDAYDSESTTTPKASKNRFVRTSVKIFIIRDKNMNEKGYVNYSDIFEAPVGDSAIGGAATAEPLLWNRKVDTLDRYDVIKEVTMELDADDPQQQFDYLISLKGNPIKFNGAAGQQLTRDSALLQIANAAALNLNAAGASAISIMGSEEQQSMTNGIYILAACMTMQPDVTDGVTTGPGFVFSSRLCFTDS